FPFGENGRDRPVDRALLAFALAPWEFPADGGGGATGRTLEARRAADFGFSLRRDHPVFYLACRAPNCQVSYRLVTGMEGTALRLNSSNGSTRGRSRVHGTGRIFSKAGSAVLAFARIEGVHRPDDRC